MSHNLAHDMKVIKESKLSIKSIMAQNGMKYEDDIKDKLLNVKPRFSLRTPNSDKPSHINCNVSYGNHRSRLKLYGVKVLPSHWNKTAQRAIVSTSLSPLDNDNNKSLNILIEKYLEKFNDFLKYYGDGRGKRGFHSELEDFMRSPVEENIEQTEKDLQELEEEIKEMEKDSKQESEVFKRFDEIFTKDENNNYRFEAFKAKEKNYVNNLERAIKVFKKFSDTLEEPISYFSQINGTLFNKFQTWLNNGQYTYSDSKGDIKKYQNRSLNDIKAQVKAALRFVGDEYFTPEARKGLSLDKRDLKDKTDSKGNEIALTDEEVWKLWNYKTSKSTDEETKDIFLLCCLTGIRGEELKDVNRIFTKDENGVVYLDFAQMKGGRRAQCRLVFKMGLDILEKYNFNLPNLNAHGRINKRMKRIAKEAGISGKHLRIEHHNGEARPKEIKKDRSELVSTHTGRRTFVTALKLREWTDEKIKKHSAHESDSMIRLYDKSRDPKMQDAFRACTKKLELIDWDEVLGIKTAPIKKEDLPRNIQQPQQPQQQFKRLPASVNEAKKVLNFFGVEPDEYMDIDDFEELIAMVCRKEDEILKHDVNRVINDVKKIFNNDIPIKDKKDALHSLVLSLNL